jgi:hypothetical protein
MFKKVTSIGSAIALTVLTAAPVMAATVTDIQAPTGYAQDVGVLISSILRVVMLIAALLVFVYLIMGGIEWITSGGEKGKTEAARNKITAAVVGLIVLAASYAILLLVLQFLGFGGLKDAFDKVGTIKDATR